MPIQFLDLDAVDAKLGQVRISGKDYDLYPMTVKNIINLTKLDEEGFEDAPVGEQVALSVSILQELIPDCPKEELENLPLSKLNALMAWVQTLGQDGMEKNSPPAKARRKAQRRLTSPE